MKFTQDPSRSLLIDETVADTFGAGNHHDYWFFEAQAGEMIRVNLDTNASRSHVELFDLQGFRLGMQAAQSPIVVIPSTGTYILLVSNADFTKTDTYTLELKSITPYPIVLGTTIFDQLDPKDLHRYFVLEAQAGDVVSISVDARSFIPIVEFWGPETNGFSTITPSQDGSKYVYKLAVDKKGSYVIQIRTLYLSSINNFELLVEPMAP